jgi:hypothetical protein
MTQKIVKIYTLSHPITGSVFYVGRTTMSLGARLSCHTTCKAQSFHMTHFLSNLKAQTGRNPIIDVVEECGHSDRKKYEEYWIQQFSAWGFELQNKRHCVNKNYVAPTERPKWFVSLTNEELELITVLHRYGDNMEISKLTGLTNERVRQIIKYKRLPARYKDKIIGFYKDRAENIIKWYNSLAA